MRQIILDTETTGIKVEEGHRIIEIGCVEMINRRLTGQRFHCYLNPERLVEAGAIAVHGISNEFLQDKPVFSTLAQPFMDFVQGAELIIHNAPFDLSFLNNELMLTRQGWKRLTDYCSIIDTLAMARKLHVGQRNSLDALCKRYNIDNSKREFHGALLDAHLLAQVYLAMTGGQGSFFDSMSEKSPLIEEKEDVVAAIAANKRYTLAIIKASEEELSEHERYLERMKKQGPCLWLEK
ncbi:MAG: DNA polymerase III subunit epsilon [Gammaproteobacteria bacterium]|nr:MAG: DNA polymerase III subunit epsilon [Gammaproteobacteria bacterium]